ncbi:ABC transporter ATP-binding protein [Nocardioidaceae bacterium SCSIO 66511]|nr:ABC transporter ATP-binding protein [Nocardioidaceae bacterium SCSIO 66511]
MTLTTTRPPEERVGGALKIAGVRKSYGDQRGVEGISLEVEPGEFLTMLGPSGSGKTTTLNLVAGFLEPDSGHIELDGAELSGVAPHRRGLGMVFQQYALFPHLTIRENVAYPLRVRKVARAERRTLVDDALELVKLGDYADRKPAELSGGQQQRVALARAFVFKPRLLLMDEPLGALDKKLRAHLQTEIARICRELGATVVYVTHDQEEALALSDRIAIYNEGRIEQIGTAEELYLRPSSIFVADFMGESSVFEGTLDGDRLRHADGTFAVGPRSGQDVADATEAALVVRPEKLRLSSADEPGESGDVNSVEATVEERVYLGVARRFVLRTRSGLALTVRVDADSDAAGLSLGDRAQVSWDPAHSVLVPRPA